MPEGDTIAWHANRIRPVLLGRVPDEITTHARFALDRWPQRLHGRAVRDVATRGKHLLLHFEGGLVLHSHLGMTGSWRVLGPEPRARRPPGPRAWIVIRAGAHEVVQLGGPLLELLTAARIGFDQRLAALGPDVLAPEFEFEGFLRRLRGEDLGRPIGDALLDQRNLAGIGNIWKAEGCWEVGLDPWRRVGEVSDAEARAVVAAVRPRMFESARHGPRAIRARVYGRTGMPCPRCGGRIVSAGQGDANRTTYWCPVCQS